MEGHKQEIQQINNTQEKQCKSTTYLESRRSRITKSFIKTNYSTMISSRSDDKVLNEDLFVKTNDRKINLITEFDDEDESEDSISSDQESYQAKKMITFSVYIGKANGRTNDMPLVIKETLEADINDFLHVLLVLFIQHVNKKLKEHGYQLVIPPNSTSIDEKKYTLKPMKKSGKPDMDLPGFDLKTKIKDFGVSSFALVYEKSCLYECSQSKVPKLSNTSNDSEKGNSHQHFSAKTIDAHTRKVYKEDKIIHDIIDMSNSSIKKISSNNACCKQCLIF
jgi:hypothetical protein